MGKDNGYYLPEADALWPDIQSLPVWDTHTHLNSSKLNARDAWQIFHYFWHLRELKAAGYTESDDTGDAQVEKLLDAYRRSANTSMHWVVERIFADLYGWKITDVRSFREADELVRESAQNPDWAEAVCRRLQIQNIVTNSPQDYGNGPFPNRLVPRLDRSMRVWIKALSGDKTPAGAAGTVRGEIEAFYTDAGKTGDGGVMVSSGPWNRFAGTTAEPASLEGNDGGDPHSRVVRWLLERCCEQAAAHGMYFQFFLGVEHQWDQARSPIPTFDPNRVLQLAGLFQRYPEVNFELVTAVAQHNLELVQVARIYPNVFTGGLWWYNFRPSSYREIMQQRLEALPAEKSALVVSDARDIEWAYGKILLIKRLACEFLGQQIAGGWINRDEALRVAGLWLSGSQAHLRKQA